MLKVHLGCLLIFLLPTSATAQLPSLKSATIDEAKALIALNGEFSSGSSVWLGDTRLVVLQHSSTDISCSIPDTGAGAFGELQVRSGLGNSSTLSVSQWKVNFIHVDDQINAERGYQNSEASWVVYFRLTSTDIGKSSGPVHAQRIGNGYWNESFSEGDFMLHGASYVGSGRDTGSNFVATFNSGGAELKGEVLALGGTEDHESFVTVIDSGNHFRDVYSKWTSDFTTGRHSVRLRFDSSWNVISDSTGWEYSTKPILWSQESIHSPPPARIVAQIRKLNGRSADFSLFPSPSKGRFTVVGLVKSCAVEVEIINSIGITIYRNRRQTTPDGAILIDDVSTGLSSGLYQVVVRQEQRIRTCKLSIEK